MKQHSMKTDPEADAVLGLCSPSCTISIINGCHFLWLCRKTRSTECISQVMLIRTKTLPCLWFPFPVFSSSDCFWEDNHAEDDITSIFTRLSALVNHLWINVSYPDALLQILGLQKDPDMWYHTSWWFQGICQFFVVSTVPFGLLGFSRKSLYCGGSPPQTPNGCENWGVVRF